METADREKRLEGRWHDPGYEDELIEEHKHRIPDYLGLIDAEEKWAAKVQAEERKDWTYKEWRAEREREESRFKQNWQAKMKRDVKQDLEDSEEWSLPEN